MSIQAIDNTTNASAAAFLKGRHVEGFDRRLHDAEVAVARAGGVDQLDPQQAKELRKASEQLVAITFIQPMLAKMREDPFKTELFHGGRTEEVFGQQMDTILADRIVAKSDFAVVDAVYRSIAERAARLATKETEVDIHA